MPKSILIIDDDVEVAETCARVLKASGFRCAVVFDLTSALALFDMLQPALVLSDINLPVGDGYEIVRHVQKTAPGTPVILMTGFDGPLAGERALRAGAAAYLRKPFSNSELISNVRGLISQDGNA
ncbi:MAG TPA: response regulator [Candidatus Binataceae bacterium]|nr:response regulator [Candidatus Binataceae bacterium]